MDPPDLFNFEKQRSGGYGQIWKATTQMGEPRALKVFDDKIKKSLYDMLREATILKLVQGSPHVVKYFTIFNGNDTSVPNYGVLGSKLFLLLEYIDGSDMWDYPEDRRVENMDWICKQCFDGLNFLHERNVVHRDLKGGNIMIEKARNESKGRVVIVDFGLSCVDPEVSDIPPCEIKHAGTYVYLSPEIAPYLTAQAAAPFKIEYANDVWGMGITLFEFFGFLAPGEGIKTLFPGFVWNGNSQDIYANLEKVTQTDFENGENNAKVLMSIETARSQSEDPDFKQKADVYIIVLGYCFKPSDSRPRATVLKKTMDRLESFQ